ncbi:AraC family transcriptional regulator [Methylobrevis pamukkalensis]|uniref:HTH-type transcriptional activator RhaR n=1 Tax=Methylobrevis pamukkalensis TaxID=1439726 RepID=A0A1E3H5I3_9HYPH|nr:helix-turn-helix transcriptional regulator [Methylobrevis pamukkalensis]ODN71577.1 HTH-type transcriptional activator RhaR [Methylobrevis pamukkalensis]
MRELVQNDSLGEVARREASTRPVIAWMNRYPAGHEVPLHRHGRGQLLCAFRGMAVVAAEDGRWLVPAGHALWIPAGVTHSLEVFTDFELGSAYLRPEALAAPPRPGRVMRTSPLLGALLPEATAMAPDILPHETEAGHRETLIMALILAEIPRLVEAPLSLPLPREPRLAALCAHFAAAPDAHDTIDRWAASLAMSRSTFTRAFRRETGLSFSAWRRQASLLAALPRLAAGESVTAIALDLGYDSAAAFTTMFRRLLGVPPRAYRAEAAAAVSAFVT